MKITSYEPTPLLFAFLENVTRGTDRLGCWEQLPGVVARTEFTALPSILPSFVFPALQSLNRWIREGTPWVQLLPCLRGPALEKIAVYCADRICTVGRRLAPLNNSLRQFSRPGKDCSCLGNITRIVSRLEHSEQPNISRSPFHALPSVPLSLRVEYG